MIGGLPVQLVSPPLSHRVGASSTALSIIAAALDCALAPAPGLLVTPAGIASVETEDEALEQAERVRGIARRTGTAMIFGLDVGPPTPGAGRLFACLGGSPVLWPACSERGFPKDGAARIVRLGGSRVLPLFASEALDPAAPRRIGKLGTIDAIVVLSHGGATTRWAAQLARLEAVAPLLVSTHHGGAGRGYASPMLGVSWLSLGGSSGAPMQTVAA